MTNDFEIVFSRDLFPYCEQRHLFIISVIREDLMSGGYSAILYIDYIKMCLTEQCGDYILQCLLCIF
jgi:hypothetical protein